MIAHVGSDVVVLLFYTTTFLLHTYSLVLTTRVRMHVHDATRGDNNIQIRPHPKTNWTETKSERVGVDVDFKFVSADPATNTVVVQTETPTLSIVDTVHFAGDTMYV